jgi:hypothetical protein
VVDAVVGPAAHDVLGVASFPRGEETRTIVLLRSAVFEAIVKSRCRRYGAAGAAVKKETRHRHGWRGGRALKECGLHAGNVNW